MFILKIYLNLSESLDAHISMLGPFRVNCVSQLQEKSRDNQYIT